MRIRFKALFQKGLKTQLLVVVVIAVVSLTIIELIAFSQIQRLYQKRTEQYLDSELASIKDSINEVLIYIRTVGYQLVGNENIQRLVSEEVSTDLLEVDRTSKDIVNFFTNASQNIIDIVLVDSQSNMMSFRSQFTLFEYRDMVQEYDFLSKDVTDPIYAAWSDEQLNSRFFLALILPIQIRDDDYQMKKIGSLVVYCYFDDLDSIVASPLIEEGESYYLYEANGGILATNQKADITPTQLADKDHKGKYVSSEVSIDFLGWVLRGVIEYDLLSGDFRIATQLIFFNSFLAVLLITGIIWAVNRNITKPISRIAEEISQMAMEDAGAPLSVSTSGEIDTIEASVKRYRAAIKFEHDEVLKKNEQLFSISLARKQTELLALQSQINPHFLYNTLESMRSIGAAYKSREIMDISTAMASIFRYSIKENDIVNLSKELAIINKYLTIMDIRFAGKYKHSIHIQDDMLDYSIPKMTIQPLVENAFYHGLEMKVPPGVLEISGSKCEDAFEITIHDTGQGIEPDKLKDIRTLIAEGSSTEFASNSSEKSIGLQNIKYRCSLTYGEGFDLQIHSEYGRGTYVTVVFPITKKIDFSDI